MSSAAAVCVFLVKGTVSIKEAIMKNLLTRIFVGFVAIVAMGGLAWSQSTTLKPQTTTSGVTPARGSQVLPTTTPPAIVKPGPKRSDTVTEEVPYWSLPGDFQAVKPHLPQFEKAPSIAAVFQPLHHQVEVFGIDPHGALKEVWKHHNDVWQHKGEFWEPAFFLSGPGFAPPGAPLTAIWYPMNEQLEVFTIGMNGGLTVTYKAHNGPWVGPSYITPPNFAQPGAHVTAVFQPLNNQLEVFAIDATGTVKLAWKEQNGHWRGPVALSPPGIAPPGAPIAAVWQPLNEQLEVFFVDRAGALRGVWKQRNGHWAPPFHLTAPGFTNPRAKIAAIWQPLNEQLEVFAVDRAGGINVIWKEHNGRWKRPYVIQGPGVAVTGAEIAALWDPREERLEVVTVGIQRRLIQVYKTHNGAWKPGPGAYSTSSITQPGIVGQWSLGAPLAGIIQPLPTGNRRVYFTLDDDYAVRHIVNEIGNYSGGAKITTANFGPIYGTRAAYCSRVFRSWSGGQDMDEPLQRCMDYTGLTAYCEGKGGVITKGYPPQSESNRILQCTPRSEPDDIIDQFVHIWKGIGQGLGTAAVATIVYSPEIAQGTACMSGVTFACASLAVTIAARAIELPDEIKEAVDLASYASSCVNGDVVSCARLGAAGARAAGVQIPGEDAGQIALLSQQCLNEDYGACLRLGEKAAMAAGVPMDQINGAAKNARACYEGNVEACIALGRQAASAGIPIEGVVNGAENLHQCSFNSLLHCRELGEAIAAVPR